MRPAHKTESEWGMVTETLNYSDYEIGETRQSVIDPTATVYVVTGWRCPRCKTEHGGELRHGAIGRCKACGLGVARFGNGLVCTG